MYQQINNQLNCSHMIRLSDRPGTVSPQAKMRVLCCMLLCLVTRGRIEGENNAQPAWCGRPLRRLLPSQRALDAARRRVLTYDAKHVTQEVTNRSTLVEANLIYRSLPDPLEALATITLHTHKSRHDITYFELGCGEGHMMLELKAIFPCIRAIGLNAAWHCEIGGLACANRREDILDAAKFFGVDGINEHNMPHVVLGDARDGFDYLNNASVDLFVSFNAFHYVLPSSGKRAVLDEVTRILKPHGIVIMSWSYTLFDDLVASTEFDAKSTADAPDAIILKGVTGYFQGVTTRAVLLVSRWETGVQLLLTRGDLYANVGHGPTYMGVPDAFFRVPERRDIEEAICKPWRNSKKKEWGCLDAVFAWMDRMVSGRAPEHVGIVDNTPSPVCVTGDGCSAPCAACCKPYIRNCSACISYECHGVR